MHWHTATKLSQTTNLSVTERAINPFWPQVLDYWMLACCYPTTCFSYRCHSEIPEVMFAHPLAEFACRALLVSGRWQWCFPTFCSCEKWYHPEAWMEDSRKDQIRSHERKEFLADLCVSLTLLLPPTYRFYTHSQQLQPPDYFRTPCKRPHPHVNASGAPTHNAIYFAIRYISLGVQSF